MKKPTVTVCILTYNRKDILLRCLDAVHKLDYDLHQVVLVDNHSTDGSVEAVKDHFPTVKIIVNDQNYGPSVGKNIGLQEILKTDVDYVYLLDCDIITDRVAVSEFVHVVAHEPSAGILGPKIYNLSVPQEFYGAGYIVDYTQNIGWGRGRGEVDEGQYDVTEEMDALLGGAMFINTQALREVGLFDEEILGYWYEGQDLCFRMKKNGYKLIYVYKSKVWHKPHKNDYSYRKKYLAGRNAIYFMRKHARLVNWLKFFFFAFFGLGYAFIVETPRGNFQGVIGKARGLLDGVLKRDTYARKLLSYSTVCLDRYPEVGTK